MLNNENKMLNNRLTVLFIQYKFVYLLCNHLKQIT